MTLRAIWEALSIGKVSLAIDDQTIQVVSIIYGTLTAIQFIIGILHNYLHDHRYDRDDHRKAYTSMYFIFYLPILLLAAAFELLILIQFSFHDEVFIGTLIAVSIYVFVRVIHDLFEEEVNSTLGIIEAAQTFGVWMAMKRKYFFESNVLRIMALNKIKKAQREALKIK